MRPSTSSFFRRAGIRFPLAAMALGLALALPTSVFAAAGGKWAANVPFQ